MGLLPLWSSRSWSSVASQARANTGVPSWARTVLLRLGPSGRRRRDDDEDEEDEDDDDNGAAAMRSCTAGSESSSDRAVSRRQPRSSP